MGNERRIKHEFHPSFIQTKSNRPSFRNRKVGLIKQNLISHCFYTFLYGQRQKLAMATNTQIVFKLTTIKFLSDEIEQLYKETGQQEYVSKKGWLGKKIVKAKDYAKSLIATPLTATEKANEIIRLLTAEIILLQQKIPIQSAIDALEWTIKTVPKNYPKTAKQIKNLLKKELEKMKRIDEELKRINKLKINLSKLPSATSVRVSRSSSQNVSSSIAEQRHHQTNITLTVIPVPTSSTDGAALSIANNRIPITNLDDF